MKHGLYVHDRTFLKLFRMTVLVRLQILTMTAPGSEPVTPAAEVIAAIAQLPELHTLEMTTTDNNAQRWIPLPSAPRLTRLHVSSAHSDCSQGCLDVVAEMPRLTSLSLKMPALSWAPLCALFHSRSMRSLSSLKIEGVLAGA